jgi:hypothetical protein
MEPTRGTTRLMPQPFSCDTATSRHERTNMQRDDSSRRLDVEKLKGQLRQCWSRESSSQWLAENPARGQCNVTALIIHESFGGEILKTPVDGQWHFYNRVNGQVYDLTAEQFSTPPQYLDLPSDRHEALAGTTARQYEALAQRFRQVLEQS